MAENFHGPTNCTKKLHDLKDCHKSGLKIDSNPGYTLIHGPIIKNDYQNRKHKRRVLAIDAYRLV